MDITFRVYDDFTEELITSHRIDSDGITYKLGAVSCAKPRDFVIFVLTGKKVDSQTASQRHVVI